MKLRNLATATLLALALAFTFSGLASGPAAAAEKQPVAKLVGTPLSLVYAAKIDGPNNHIAFTIMLQVADKRVPVIFEGKPQHPVLDALAAVQAEIDDGDDETITINASLLGSIPNATYPHGAYVLKDIRVGDYFWQSDYFKYKG
ncbi:MAG: hypothetical protein MPJ78_18605 [Hyphomicrobiaceae bacterium]|nr:hypothetical protein [Hyphomicrobiaceae bacterium]